MRRFTGHRVRAPGTRSQTLVSGTVAGGGLGASDTSQRSADAVKAIKGMMGPQGLTDTVTSKAPFMPGKATPQATKATMDRSSLFEQWCHRSTTGLYMSKLGCTTCKMPRDMSESEDSLQLQVIKGLNVFEIDGSASDVYQNVSKSFSEVFNAFELDRSGFVFVLRVGMLRQPFSPRDMDDFEVMNTSHVRERTLPVLERYKASSLPGQNMRSGYNIEKMDDAQLRSLNLRRTSLFSAAAVTPNWLDASLTNVAYNMNVETMDVLLIEGLYTLYDGRPEEEIEKDLLEVFQWAEAQVAKGGVQHYGISSPTLAPPLPRVYPPLPPDAKLPAKYKEAYVPPATMNLHRIMKLAEKAGGEKHNFRYLSYPFNLTQSQALGTPLPYDPKHTLCTLSKHYGLTTLSHNPVETIDLQDKAQRYHRFPMTSDLARLRNNFFHLAEKVIMKEREIKAHYDKMTNAPPPHWLFVGSMYAQAQYQLSNAFQVENWINFDVLPPLRRALSRVRESGNRDIKDWANAFDMLVNDMLRLRLQMFHHKHGVKNLEIDAAIDKHAPSLKKCPIVTQKALTFATHGADVTMCGFHASRYFHEATELNPLFGQRIPIEELRALCATKEVSYCDHNPPHPYMFDTGTVKKEADISGQKSGLEEILQPIDPQRPDWPDIPKQIGEDGKPIEPAAPEKPDSLFSDKGRVGNAKIANYGLQNWATDEYFDGKTE